MQGAGPDLCRLPHPGFGRRPVAGRRGGRGTHPGPATAVPRAWCVVAPRPGVPLPRRAALGVPAGVTRPGAARRRSGTVLPAVGRTARPARQ